MDATLTFQDVQIEQLIKRLEIKVPVKVAGRLSFRLQVGFPVNTPKDLKLYRLDGTIELPSAQIADLRFEGAKAVVHYRNGILNLKEFSGRLRGADVAKPGTFSGTARLGVEPRADLNFQFNVNDLPLAQLDSLLPATARGLGGSATGMVKGTAPFAQLQDPSRWQAEARLSSPLVAWSGLRLQNLDMAAKLDKGSLSLSKLQGQLEEATLTGSASLRLSEPIQFDTKFSLTKFNLSSLSRLAPSVRPPVALAGTIDVDVNAQGPLDLPGITAGGSVRANRLAIDLGGSKGAVPPSSRRVSVSAVSLKWGLEKGTVKIADLSARLYGGEITGSGSVPLEEKGKGNVALKIKNVEVGEIVKTLAGAALQVEGRLSGTVNASVTTEGKSRAVNADIDVSAETLKVQRIPAERLRGKVTYHKGEAVYSLSADALGGKVKLEGKLPAAAPKTEPSGETRLEIRGALLSRLWPVLRLNDTLGSFEGRATAVLEIDLGQRGSLPSGSGFFEIRNLRWGEERLTDVVRGTLVLDRGGLMVRSIDTLFAGGSLTVSFRYGFTGPTWITVTLREAESSQLFVFAPGLKDSFQGPVNVELRASRNGDWNGTGTLTMSRGRVFGLAVGDWAVPMRFSFSTTGRGELTVTESGAAIGHGRARLTAHVIWDGGMGARVEGNLQLFDAQMSSIASQLSSYTEGRVNGRVDFRGENVRSANDLSANIQATLRQVQSQQIPILSQILRFVTPGRGATTFQNGQLKARLGGGVVRIEGLELNGDLVEMFMQGAVTLQGGLDLLVVARTTNQLCSNPLLVRVIASQVPAVGPVPVALLAQISTLLANRVVQLRVTGTINSPQIRVDPVRLLTHEAARYFINRLVLPR